MICHDMPSYATKSLPSFGFQKWSETGQLGRKMGFFRKNRPKTAQNFSKNTHLLTKMNARPILNFQNWAEICNFYQLKNVYGRKKRALVQDSSLVSMFTTYSLSTYDSMNFVRSSLTLTSALSNNPLFTTFSSMDFLGVF